MYDYILIEDGKITKTIKDRDVWNGLFSRVLPNGALIKYLETILPKDTIFVIPRCDGMVPWDNIESFVQKAHDTNKTLIIGTLAEVEEFENINYVYLPLSDEFFEYGTDLNNPFQPIKWNDKSDELYWKGSCSGMFDWCKNDRVRLRFVQSLFNRSDASNVRLSYRQSDGKNIPTQYFFGDWTHYTEFTKHKIHFIVDGNVISSMHMFGFMTGGIPFLISNAKFWFQSYIIPNVHYIPIKYDLSDLHEKIDWVKNNDKEAERIADNALEFSKTHFTPDFQRKYLKDIIDNFIQK